MVKIVGFNLNKVSVEKLNEVKGKIEIKSNLNITEVSKENIELAEENDVVAFGFEYSINYQPKIADVIFLGDVLLMLPKAESKEVFKKWKKKQIPDEIRLAVFNIILSKCNIKALQLEEDTNLPTHIPMPKLAPPQQQKSYTR